MERAKAKENCTRGSDFNLSVVSRDVLEDTAFGVGELATRSRSVGLNKNMHITIQGKTHCKEIFVNGRAHRRKDKITACPKEKDREKEIGKRNNPGEGNRSQDQIGSPDEETGQRRLDDFGLKRQKIELVGDFQGHNDFEAPEVDRAAYVFFSQKCKSGMIDWMKLPSSSTSGMQVSGEPAGTHGKNISPQESRYLPRDVEMNEPLLTLETLCSRAQRIMRHQFQPKEPIAACIWRVF